MGSLASARLPFLFKGEPMLKDKIPFLCLHCIERFQAQCPHIHTSFSGGWHFDGEPWDDITEVCDNCGAVLDDLPHSFAPLPEYETIAIKEEPLCAS